MGLDTDKLIISLDPKTNRKIINGKYRIIKKIGQGQYGKVLLGECVDKQICPPVQYVAIKTINRIEKARLITKTYQSSIIKIKREIQIMKECNHPNVVKLYQVIDDTKFDKILLILEYCKFGEIDWKHYNHYYEKYTKHEYRKPLTLNKILRDVINGLEYLHDYKKIIHRDLKPSNLLIDETNTIKISDFGVSLILENETQDLKELAKTMGTPAFYAPELCQFVNNRYSMITNANHAANKVKIDFKIDIWSLGVTMYSLMFNDLPFNGGNEFEMCKNIVQEQLKFPKIKHSKKVTTGDIEELGLFKDLIKKMLIKDPKDRIDLQSIKLHQFTTFDYNEAETRKFLNFNSQIFKDANTKKELNSTNNDPSFKSRLKKLFMGKTTSLPSIPIIKEKTSPISGGVRNTASDQALDHIRLKELEHVDDLLDSYLDDSSSLGSDLEDEDEHVEVFDTTNILGELKDIISNKKVKSRPEPLELKSSTFIFDNENNNKKNISRSSSEVSSPQTPTTDNVTTIGAASTPTSSVPNIQVFSPAKRYFSKNKETETTTKNHTKKKPTIVSLSSPQNPKKNNDNNVKNKYIALAEPPPIFALTSKQPLPPQQQQPVPLSPSHSRKSSNESRDEQLLGSPISSRKNSISSQVFGYGLSRITSSSSSLNLNAYLTDDEGGSSSGLMKHHSTLSTKYSLRSYRNSNNSKESEESEEDDEYDTDEDNNDETLVFADDSHGSGGNGGNNYRDMRDFLNRLE
ncbi:uncharacterized protein J8A68_002799 [[Candida] subhashii]|uniref:Protein kinase domain-containing protein n=1 Tax=[Candida] subhashii TaxID=561895 RepID=A0A8J5QNR1_9ASCO|nr:uncharacterized protein J8A68_002799 [[Candida] subhashii]KAG7663683.1 hypothetical protein J8A68_002799 [[Candida] subhashii]